MPAVPPLSLCQQAYGSGIDPQSSYLENYFIQATNSPCFMKLIIPMAGRGTRVRPHSHVTPKPLLSVKGRSIVERIVDTFNRVLSRPIDAGVFVLGPDFGDEVRDQLRGICDRNAMEAHFTTQETAEGTAHAVHCAGEHLAGEGLIVFADTLFDMEPGVAIEDNDVVIWVKHVEDPSRFGVAVRDGDKVVRLVEKPDEPISNEAIIGIYYVNDLSRLQGAIQDLLDADIRGKGGEYQLTDAMDALLQDGATVGTAAVTEWLDCGTIPALLDTTGHILNKESNSLKEGAIKNCVIHEPVYVGPGAHVEGCVLGPRVSVEAGATIHNSVIQNSIVFSEAAIEGAVLKDSLVGQHATVRPSPMIANIGDHSALGPRA